MRLMPGVYIHRKDAEEGNGRKRGFLISLISSFLEFLRLVFLTSTAFVLVLKKHLMEGERCVGILFGKENRSLA